MRARGAMEEGERMTSTTNPVSKSKSPPTSGPAANGGGAAGRAATPTAGATANGGGAVGKPAPPTADATANGGGAVGKTAPSTGRGSAKGGQGFAGIAKMISSQAKEQKGDAKRPGHNGESKKQTGCDDDLPLGSEAHSLSFEHTNGINGSQVPRDKRATWLKTASQGIMGWQSFNSDVSNQTSASSASLEMLLNERQMDPEEMLLNLGFGGESQSYVPSLARVPARFLHHPSRAYGISAPGTSEEGEGEGEEVATASAAATTSAAAAPGAEGGTATPPAPAIPPAKKRTGIWTLARTLSLFRPRPPVNQMSSSTTPSGTPPLSSQILSILHPTNQRYLASRGYYQKQGWPAGTFLEADEAAVAALKDPDDSQDAATRRRQFQKTRSRRNWSLCGSGDENEGAASRDAEWITKSMDDSLSREDLMGRDSSLGRGTYFSTTTESSTDSLDGHNTETERAFEEIRRQYNESRRKERSSSEDLFLPRRKKRLSSDVMEQDEHDEAIGDEDVDEEDYDHLSTNPSNNYFVSPASSRQATVEKAPTLCEHSSSICINENGDKEHNANDDNNNRNRLGKNSFERRTGSGDGNQQGSSDVRIIVSSSESTIGRSISHDPEKRTQSPSKLTVSSPQRTPSDSGSSSSTSTAVGSFSVATATDDADTLRLSESEHSVTDKDSISRTHSPCAFTPTSSRSCEMVTSFSQTSDSDFKMAAAAAAGQRTHGAHTVRIRRSGMISPAINRRERELVQLEDGPKVQLSPLPTAINPIELMKRLQHSQDELSRMGSIQSDSSGFGDAEPGAEPGAHDLENLKVASMGSSGESSGTLASSAITAILREPPARGEMATQTSVDYSKGKLGHLGEDKSNIKQSPRPSGEDPHFVTMCYIPPRGSRASQSEGLRYRGAGPGSRPPTYISEFQRPRGDSEPILDFSSHVYLRGEDHSYARPRGNSDAFTSNALRYEGPNYDPRWRGYEEHFWDSPLRQTSELYPQRRLDREQQFEPVRTSTNTVNPRLSRGWSIDREGAPVSRSLGSQKTYSSRIDLYASESGLHQTSVSHRAHSPQLRRHSDEGILEGRNDQPLSIELALALSPSGRGTLISSSVPGASSSTTAKPTTTAANPATSKNTTTTAKNVISTTSIYIPFRNSTTNTNSSTSSLTTPAHYKTRAGFHFPPLAGNLSGLQTDKHSTPKPTGSSRSQRPTSARQKSCDILEDDFSDGDPIAAPDPDRVRPANQDLTTYTTELKRFPRPGIVPSWQETYGSANRPPLSSRMSDDMETYSSVAESSSDFSIQSMPEGITKSGILDSRKLARLINQPIYFKGQRRGGSHYRPRRLFKEWTMLSKRKRLQEENRLLQYTIQKYKTDLSIMETSFMVDYQTAYQDMTEEEREEAEELEWLWGEVRGQVMEMERLLLARIKSVHAGNDFHSLMSNLGIINKTIELMREQIYQQKVANSRMEEMKEAEMEDELDQYDLDPDFMDRRSGSFHSTHSWMSGPSYASPSSPHPFRRFHSSSTSNLPSDLNLSLEQIKSSLLSRVQQEMRESTKKLEQDLQEKDKEIKNLKEQLSRSFDSAEKTPKRWTPKSARLRSTGEGRSSGTRSRSRSRLVGDSVVQETDV